MSDTREIELEAARWAVRTTRTLKAADQEKLDAWLEVDARHRGAYVRARAAWLDLDRVSALTAGVDADEHEAARAGHESPTTTRRALLAAGLSGVALVGGISGWWVWRESGEIYETDIGEVRRITLADGSSMLLNTATRARVHLRSEQRLIELERGEASFEVAKDRHRPFIVRARGVSVQAVGTAFTVRAIDQNVAVTVTEGVVEVGDSSVDGAAYTQRVVASQQAVVSASSGIQVQKVSNSQVERYLAWQEGMLSFDGERLADAVAEVNRHNRRRIRIDDAALAERPVVGLFRASDPRGFAQTVAAALGAESVEDGDVIHLQPHAASP